MERFEARCDRYEGALSFEHFANTTEDGKRWAYEGWHCIFCGEVIDPVILLNREVPKRIRGASRGKGVLIKRTGEFPDHTVARPKVDHFELEPLKKAGGF